MQKKKKLRIQIKVYVVKTKSDQLKNRYSKFEDDIKYSTLSYKEGSSNSFTNSNTNSNTNNNVNYQQFADNLREALKSIKSKKKSTSENSLFKAQQKARNTIKTQKNREKLKQVNNMFKIRNEKEKARQARLNTGISNNKFSSNKLIAAALNTTVPNFAKRSTNISVSKSQNLNKKTTTRL